jgi:hypothetical protein
MLPTQLDDQAADLALAELLPECPTREQIEHFAQLVLQVEHEQGMVDIGTVHHLAGDVYGRSVLIPAGHALVGLPHKKSHLCVCVGDIQVWTEGKSQRLTGLHVLPAEPGAMRIGRAFADTFWLAVHANPTRTTDIEALENDLFEHAHLLMDRRARGRQREITNEEQQCLQP